MTKSPYHFEVEGPCRDYDITTFCEDHDQEALEYASEWLKDVFDSCEVGEERSITVRVCAGKVDRCYECCPTQPEEEP